MSDPAGLALRAAQARRKFEPATQFPWCNPTYRSTIPLRLQDGVSDPADWPSELLKPAPWGDVSSDKFAFAAPLVELKKWVPTRPDNITRFYDVVQARPSTSH